MKIIDRLSWAVLILMAAYLLFFAGRLYETRRFMEIQRQEESKKIEMSMKDHGTPYAWKDKGAWYFYDARNRKCKL